MGGFDIGNRRKKCRKNSSLGEIGIKISHDLHEYLSTFMIKSRSTVPEWRQFSDESCRQNQNTIHVDIYIYMYVLKILPFTK
jgi:hypothetical protein